MSRKIRKILSLAGLYLHPRADGARPAASKGSRAAPPWHEGSDPFRNDGAVPVDEVRAVATEAALATAVDASPAVLVSLWAHDERLHPGDRPPARRGR